MEQEQVGRRREISGQGPAGRSGGAAARREDGDAAMRMFSAAAGERQELAWAMAQVVGREGYGAASVAAAVAAAGSSPAAFERHFADKQECYLVAHELLLGRALDAVGERFEAELPWAGRVLGGLERAVELCLGRAELARALLVCPSEVGAPGARRALLTCERFAELIAPEPELAEELPPRAALMAASGVIGLIGEELERGESADLGALAPELGFALLMPLLGPAAAGEELERAGVGVPR
jgi:AcrR family transcriptional regulator